MAQICSETLTGFRLAYSVGDRATDFSPFLHFFFHSVNQNQNYNQKAQYPCSSALVLL